MDSNLVGALCTRETLAKLVHWSGKSFVKTKENEAIDVKLKSGWAKVDRRWIDGSNGCVYRQIGIFSFVFTS